MVTGQNINRTNMLSAVTLESTEAATQSDANKSILDTSNCSKINLSCAYTTGAGETSNTCNITVHGYAGNKTIPSEIAADSANWFQLGGHTISTGTATFTPTILAIAGASAATTYKANFLLDCVFQKIRIAASETGVATNKGKLTVTVSAL